MREKGRGKEVVRAEFRSGKRDGKKKEKGDRRRRKRERGREEEEEREREERIGWRSERVREREQGLDLRVSG